MNLGCIVKLICTIALLAPVLPAQQDRIVKPIDAARTVVLRGLVPAKATPQSDAGPVAPSFVLHGMTLSLRPSPAQQDALNRLLDEQRDPASPNFHKWLTPEQYGARFGASPNDIAKLTTWLRSRGFSVDGVARGRSWIVFSGAADQVQKTFGASIHQYWVDGQPHFANATDPSIPAALDGIVSGIQGLDDFVPAATVRPRGQSANGNINLVPSDLATIYNFSMLYRAGIDGLGVTIAVVGQTNIDPGDIHSFRSKFNLPDRAPEIHLVPNATDPGTVASQLPEADLDVEWAGGVAPNATIKYVYSQWYFSAVQYAVDQNLAPIISSSYNEACSGQPDAAKLAAFRQTAQQANSQGITWINGSGDTGAAGCDGFVPVAQNGPVVPLPVAMPEVTSVGGTELGDETAAYWNNNNDPNGAAAKSYIPENSWNDTAGMGFLFASGGGSSTLISKPNWQTGSGVPDDGRRDVPDASLSAAAATPYLVITGGSQKLYAGTSAAAPAFAGMVALLSQYLTSAGVQQNPGLGNVNPIFYRLAANNAAAFHDITQGNNVVPCASGSTGCTNGSFGYNAGPGYDLVTGLGTPDLYNMAHAWSAALQGSSSQPPSIGGVSNAASGAQIYAPGMLMSIYGAQLVSAPDVAQSAPLPTYMKGFQATINGIAAPLWFVSDKQANVQIPYETEPGTARLVIANGQQTATFTFTVAATAPGIFLNYAPGVAPGTALAFGSTARGQAGWLYITGDGAVSPAIASGATPSADTPLSNLPKPVANVSMSIGGKTAQILFAGIPNGDIGVTQINFMVPADAALGPQQLIVTVGGVASAATTFTVTQ